jgi:hypothetical protein
MMRNMIIAHAIVGATAGNYFGHFWYFFLGSVFTDIDHLYVLIKNRIFALDRIVDSMRFEKKYHLSYRTKLMHSLLGAILFSAPLLLIDGKGAGIFFASYLGHLLLDWLDYDIKYYLYPLKIKFKGFLPIFSQQEIIFTLGLCLLFVLSLR